MHHTVNTSGAFTEREEKGRNEEKLNGSDCFYIIYGASFVYIAYSNAFNDGQL